MKKAKEAFNKTKREMLSEMKHINSKAVMLAAVMFAVFVVSAAPVLAAGGLFDELDSAFTKVYGALVLLAPVVTGVAYVAGKLWQILVPEKQGRAEPREWARSALVNYFLILAAGGIIGFIADIAGNIK